MTWFVSSAAGLGIAIASATTVAVLSYVGHRTAMPIFLINTVMETGLFVACVFVLTEVKILYQRERENSRVDFVTGLLNHRAMIELLGTEIRRIRRVQRPATVIYMDIDNFKEVNDRFGHNEGDRLLRELGQAIKSGLRATDLIARLGGDEFAILLPETDSEAAQAVAAKLYGTLLELAQEKHWPITCSFGVVTFATPPSSAEKTLAVADATMYSAKRNGKDRIEHRLWKGETVP
ncbi:MAG TPA: GGDEF domain-containing protein [Candidatus Angelobacter sp.]|nr:GGDEF domain-containing protein [Candidatus Angelobacter sp.]